MEARETQICKLCLEPLFNFICVDCLAKDVKKFLFSDKPELRKEFESFHEKFSKFFLSSNPEKKVKCIRCKRTFDVMVCPYCYINELFWWLFGKDIELARKLAQFFNFDFLGTGYVLKLRKVEPIIIAEDQEKDLEIGICESCGQAYDGLKKVEGKWLCETCRDEL
ncbi:MAG: hypothetical protein DRP00_01350 [Candidatus Aenigmatarchaeota archaeon]|nr:MAG: hypothetical protein DRP00_01350 [Candidatus Aenigmarchaeota archaeon]